MSADDELRSMAEKLRVGPDLRPHTCEVCGRTAWDVARRTWSKGRRERWSCTDKDACLAAYRKKTTHR